MEVVHVSPDEGILLVGINKPLSCFYQLASAMVTDQLCTRDPPFYGEEPARTTLQLRGLLSQPPSKSHLCSTSRASRLHILWSNLHGIMGSLPTLLVAPQYTSHLLLLGAGNNWGKEVSITVMARQVTILFSSEAPLSSSPFSQSYKSRHILIFINWLRCYFFNVVTSSKKQSIVLIPDD